MRTCWRDDCKITTALHGANEHQAEVRLGSGNGPGGIASYRIGMEGIYRPATACCMKMARQRHHPSQRREHRMGNSTFSGWKKPITPTRECCGTNSWVTRFLKPTMTFPHQYTIQAATRLLLQYPHLLRYRQHPSHPLLLTRTSSLTCRHRSASDPVIPHHHALLTLDTRHPST